MQKAKGFTLIELLVVISIIGMLASIILVSVNAARNKGVGGAIISELRDMMNQAEMVYSSNNPNDYTGICASLANTIAAISNIGGTAACYSYDNTRWGVSVKLNSDSTKNWSVSPSGVATWDATDVSGSVLSWSNGKTACATTGGRMASLEELEALYIAYGSVTPPGFRSNVYWSSTSFPPNPAGAFNVFMTNGSVGIYSVANQYYIRCIH